MRIVRLFLYGTLMGESGTPIGRWTGERIVSAVPATVPGRLFALADPDGWYPALVSGCGGRVHGVLAELRLAAGDLTRLDRYEGREYRRRTVPVCTQRGKYAAAQAWCWRLPLPSGARPIADGDFPGWLVRTGNRPFGHRQSHGAIASALANRCVVH